jgi:streptomycin 6-kinase
MLRQEDPIAPPVEAQGGGVGDNADVSSDIIRRVDERVAAWQVIVDRIVETETSLLAFGRRDGRPVVVKVVRRRGEEWHCGKVVAAFDGNGMVRAYDHTDGAVLLEQVQPATSLATIAVSGADGEATATLADVIGRLSPRDPPEGVPTVADWGEAFARHIAKRVSGIPTDLVLQARDIYSNLCRSQSTTRLLHGDLHHDNVLLDSTRGWLAIDPKGVVGELEYEIGAALRNPYQQLQSFANARAIERRVEIFQSRLGIDAGRTLRWGFAQAVLAAVWAVEDGAAVGPESAWIALAGAVRPMITA